MRESTDAPRTALPRDAQVTIPKFVECNSEHVFHKLPPSRGLPRIVDQSTALYHVDTKELTSSGAIADIFQRYREILPEYPTHTLRAFCQSGPKGNGSRRLLNPSSTVATVTSCSLLLLALWIFTVPIAGYAQTPPATSALAEEEKLERDFTDPLSTLPQLLVRDSYTPANFGPGPCTSQVCLRNYETNQVLLRPLIPRIPPESLLPFSQLIRPTFALVTVQSSRGGTRTEFGDLPVFDIAVLPWPDRQKTGLLIGVGPTFVFPTATSKSAGQGAWQAGPALGAIYTGIPGLLVGFVAQNPVSFAYTSPNRLPQNTFQFQPVFALHLWDKWYLRSAEANWMMGWRRHYPTTLPLSIGLGRTIVRPGLPPMSIFVTGQWMAYRQYAPIAPQTTINFGLTVAFPQIRDYFSQ